MLTESLQPYRYPGPVKPFKLQIATTEFLVQKLRAFVFNEIGTGKTLSVAWAMDRLMREGQVKNVLIVAPLSTLDIVWKRTLFQVNPALDVEVMKGTATQKRESFRAAALYKSKPLVRIINPDSLHILAEQTALEHYDLVIIDESATFRVAKTRRGKALKKIVADKAKRLWCLTGSPTPEAPTDVWFTATLVCPDRVPRYFGALRDMTMMKVSQWSWKKKPDAEKIIAEMLKDHSIRFTRAEIELPPTTFFTHNVDPTAEQTRLLKELKDEAAAQLEAGEITAANEADVINKMLQVTGGSVLARDENEQQILHKVDCAGKFQALEDLYESSDGPVIVFAPFLGNLARLVEWAEAKHIPYRLVVGATSRDERTEAFDLLQNGGIRLLIAHPKAMAHGITLTRSNLIVWWVPIQSHEIYEQACGRITRPGQEKLTYIVHFTCSALERRVYKRLADKRSSQGLLLEYLQTGEKEIA